LDVILDGFDYMYTVIHGNNYKKSMDYWILER
jgi:hypothetical protein